MKKFHSYIILTIVVVFFTSSCKGQDSEIENALRQCVNEKANHQIQELSGKPEFDFYEFSLKAEQVLLSHGLIRNTEKQEYLELLKNLNTTGFNEGREAYDGLQELTDNYGFNYNLFTIVDGVLNNCSYEVYTAHNLSKNHLIYRQGIYLLKLTDNGYYKSDLIKNLFNELEPRDFENIVYRAPIIYLVLMNMDFKFDSTLKRKIDPSEIIGN